MANYIARFANQIAGLYDTIRHIVSLVIMEDLAHHEVSATTRSNMPQILSPMLALSPSIEPRRHYIGRWSLLADTEISDVYSYTSLEPLVTNATNFRIECISRESHD